MVVKAMDLFEAYRQDHLPRDRGCVVSAFFSNDNAYSIYEIVSYAGVEALCQTDAGLAFQAGGKKLYVLVEPAAYPKKAVDPPARPHAERIPLRFSELEILTAKNKSRIMIGRRPADSFSSFTILKPSGMNFALVFYNLPDIFDTLGIFFEKTFNREAGIPQEDAQKCARRVTEILRAAMSFREPESGFFA